MATSDKDRLTAIRCIQESTIFVELKARVLAVSRDNIMPKEDQVALHKLGNYTETRWGLLRQAMAPFVNLMSASSIRKVRFSSTHLFDFFFLFPVT